MAVPVIMPRQGNTVESCIVTQWMKKPGDAVAVGDILFSYETDKAAFEEESKVAGTLLAAFFEEGDDVPVLVNMCVIGNPGESTAEFDPNATAKAEAPEPEPSPDESRTPAADVRDEPAAAPLTTDGGFRISPRARALAERTGADLSKVSPTGPEGRVIARDVQALKDKGLVVTPAARGAYAGGAEGTGGAPGSGLGGRVTLGDLEKRAETAPAPAEGVAPQEDSYVEPMTNMRKVIARSMSLSLSSMAQLTNNLSFDATEIQALRKSFKDKGEAMGMNRITVGDIILYAVARTLADPKHRALNAHLIDDGKTMKYFRPVNLGFAVDTERGLMVPVLFGADRMSLKQLSDEVKRLAAACQAGSINPDLLQGGSFTVSNLGALGIESFTPVINPPQTGILGVCAITTRVREVNGQPICYPAMNLSLTYDHRAIDGAPASRFLKDLKENLENITLLLAK